MLPTYRTLSLPRWVTKMKCPFNSVGFSHKWVKTGCNNRLPMDGALVTVGPHSLWSCTLNSNKTSLGLISMQQRQFYAFCLIWKLYFTAWSNNVCLTGHHFNNGCKGSNPANPTKKKWSLAGTNKYPESHKIGRFLFVVATDLYYHILPFLVPRYWGITIEPKRLTNYFMSILILIWYVM